MTEADGGADPLIDRAAGGDATAQAQLWRLHADRLRRAIARRLDPRLRSRVDASDIVQEAFAEAARKLPAYAADRPLPFYPWLRRIALERLIDLHRRHVLAQRRTVRRESPPLPASGAQGVSPVAAGTEPFGGLLRDERRDRLQALLDQLPSGDRELLMLRHLDQLSMRDIAVRLGMNEGAVKTRHVRALQRLRRLLPPASEGSL